MGLNIMASNRGIYRLTVTDSRRQVRGILSGLRILETLIGRRGIGIKKRIGKNFESFFRQPIRLFISEYLHKLSYTIPLHGLISYIAENNVGHIVLVDQLNELRGVVTERCIIDKLKAEHLGIKVSDIMTSPVYTANPKNTLLDVITLMTTHKIRRVPILDEEKILGIVTVTDILQHLIISEYQIEAILSKTEDKEFFMKPIGTVDYSKPQPINGEQDLDSFIKKLLKIKHTGFPVVQEKKIVGLISSRDIVSKTPKLVGVDRFTEAISLTTN
jgi:CBS domain-containing protein